MLPCNTETVTVSRSNFNPNIVQSDNGEKPFEKQLEDLDCELR